MNVKDLAFKGDADQSQACKDAIIPIEHRDCHTAECACRCHRPKVAVDHQARRLSHDPRKMLDHSEVGVGCWVERGQSPDLDAEGRGGVVIGIDRLADPDTGELVRIYSTAKEWRGGIRFAQVREPDVDRIELPNSALVQHLWRAMCREVGKKKRALMTEEMRLIETAYQLMRSVA